MIIFHIFLSLFLLISQYQYTGAFFLKTLILIYIDSLVDMGKKRDPLQHQHCSNISKIQQIPDQQQNLPINDNTCFASKKIIKHNKQKRAYKRKPHQKLWQAYIETIVQQKQIFFTWQYQLRIDLFKIVAKKLKCPRDSVKSWNQTQKQKFLIKRGVDLMEAIEQTMESDENQEKLKQPQMRKKYDEFLNLLKKKQQVYNLLQNRTKQSIQLYKKTSKRFKDFIKTQSKDNHGGISRSQYI